MLVKHTWIMLACVLGLSSSTLYAQTLSGGGTLKEPVGVNHVGMAETGTGFSGNAQALHYNPAGLSDLARAEVDTMYTSGRFSNQTAHLLAALPTPWLGGGSLALACLAEIGPTMEINNLDGSSESLVSQRDYVFTAGYGSTLAKNISAGAALKVFHSTLLEQYSATAVGCDIGLLYHDLLSPGLNLGLALQNLGTSIRYVDEGDPMPTTLRMGLGYSSSLGNQQALKTGVDVLLPNDSDPLTHLGMEYNWQERFFVRGGYKFGYALDSFTLGLGLTLNRIRLDYAFAKMSAGTDIHRIGLGFAFDAAAVPVQP